MRGKITEIKKITKAVNECYCNLREKTMVVYNVKINKDAPTNRWGKIH